MLSEVFVQHVEKQVSKTFVFTTCAIQPLPGSGDAGVDTRRIMAILGHRCMQISARYTHATDEGLRRAMEMLAQTETLAQREKTDRHSFPHSDEQRSLLAAVSY
jgi:hypothetical protein